MKEYEYGSICVSVPLEISRSIRFWGSHNIPDANVIVDERYRDFGREGDPHITIKFGLQVKSHMEVEKVVSKFGAFKVELGGISKFSHEGYDIIKVDVSSGKLRDLNLLVQDSLVCVYNYKKYKPHVTVAYVKRNSCDHLLSENCFKNTSWNVDHVFFSFKDKIRISIK